MSHRQDASDRVSLTRLICFSAAAVAPQGLLLALTIHLPRYFAGHVGLGLAAVGAAFTIVRLLDIALDPMLGAAMDRTRTRLGRYKPWLILGAPILMGSSYMLFVAPVGAGELYLIAWLLVFYAAISIVQLAHAAWAGALSDDYRERSRIFGLAGSAGLLGSALVMLVPAAVSRWLGDDDTRGLHAMAIAMIVLVPVLTAVALVVPERLRAQAPKGRVELREYVVMLWRPAMRRVIVADLALALGPGTLTPIFVFYWRDARGASLANVNLMLVLFMAAGLLGAPFWGAVAQRIGKHRAVIVSTVCFSLGQLGIVSLPAGSPLALPGMFVLGFFVSAFNLLVRAIVADVADEVRLDFGRERSGLLFAMVTSTQKVGGAVSVAITFWILAVIGYNPAGGSVNSPENLRGLEILYAAAPVVFVLLGAAAFVGFPLTAQRHAQIRAELAALEATDEPTEAPPRALRRR